jgi:hypothetical protein
MFEEVKTRRNLPPVHVTVFDDGRRAVSSGAAYESELKLLSLARLSARKITLEAGHVDEDIIDIQPIDDFLRSEGLEAPDTIIIDVEKIPGLNEAYDQSPDLNLGICYPGEAGKYFPCKDLAIVVYDSEMEKNNGPLYTQALVLHEKLHKSHVHKSVHLSVGPDGWGNYYAPRVGQIISPAYEGSKGEGFF